MTPRGPLLALLVACALAACAPLAAAGDCAYDCAYSTVLTGRPQSADSAARCLSACQACIRGYNTTSSCGFFFIPQFDSTGTFASSTCQSTCEEELPAWAIVAISLGTAIVLGVIAGMTFIFVCCCMRQKVALAKARAQAQQGLPSTTTPVPKPEEAPMMKGGQPAVQDTCVGIPATNLQVMPYGQMSATPYPPSNTVSYPPVKDLKKGDDKPTKPPFV